MGSVSSQLEEEAILIVVGMQNWTVDRRSNCLFYTTSCITLSSSVASGVGVAIV